VPKRMRSFIASGISFLPAPRCLGPTMGWRRRGRMLVAVVESDKWRKVERDWISGCDAMRLCTCMQFTCWGADVKKRERNDDLVI